MATEVKLPELGENVETGKVVKVLVSSGDEIDEEQPIIEVETDKASVEVPSSAGGRVREIKVQQGDEVNVGDVLVVLDGAGDGAEGNGGEEQDEAESGTDAEETGAKRKSRDEGDGEDDGGLDDETPSREDKQPESERAERSDEPHAAGEAEQKQRDRAEAEREGQATTPSTGSEEAKKSSRMPPVEGAAESKVIAAPSVRRLARELSVDLETIQGSGPGGRILLEDVRDRAARTHGGPGRDESARRSGPAEADLPDFTAWGEVERRPLSGVRAKTAEHMTRSWTTIPHVTFFDRADVTEVEAIRQQYKAKAEEAGGKLTMTAIMVRVVAAALRAFPRFNASIDLANEQLIVKRYCHVGVAVDTDRGLLVPVVRDADQKSIITLSAELKQLAERARDGELKPDDMQGGTFSVTNLGSVGIESFTPIVNHPQIAILAVGRARQEPVYGDDGLTPRLMLPLGLAVDHRALDGADGARFLRWIVHALEEPLLLTMEG